MPITRHVLANYTDGVEVNVVFLMSSFLITLFNKWPLLLAITEFGIFDTPNMPEKPMLSQIVCSKVKLKLQFAIQHLPEGSLTFLPSVSISFSFSFPVSTCVLLPPLFLALKGTTQRCPIFQELKMMTPDLCCLCKAAASSDACHCRGQASEETCLVVRATML